MRIAKIAAHKVGCFGKKDFFDIFHFDDRYPYAERLQEAMLPLGTNVEEYLSEQDILLVSEEEYDQYSSSKRDQYYAPYRKRIEQKEEEAGIALLRQKYPLEKMEEILASNPRPNFVEALERGIAWSRPLIQRQEDGLLFRREGDGSIAACPLGAIYIGCFGLSNLPLEARQHIGLSVSHLGNQAFKDVMERIRETIRFWMRGDGTFRDREACFHGSIYVSGAARGSSTKARDQTVQEHLYERGSMARSLMIESVSCLDMQLEKSSKYEKI